MVHQQKKQFLTQEGYDKLLEELNDLKTNQLPATLERLKEAISQWDISENAEYDSSMTEKELIEGRMAEIDAMLTNVEIIELDKSSGTVEYGSVVSFVDDKDRNHTYTIVGTAEVDVLANKISLESPVWLAIKGKKKWDIATVKAPNRRYTVEITNVE